MIDTLGFDTFHLLRRASCYNDAILQLEAVKAEKDTRVEEIKIENSLVSKQLKHEYESVIFSLNNTINKKQNKMSRLILNCFLNILPRRNEKSIRNYFQNWKCQTLIYQQIDAVSQRYQKDLRYIFHLSKEQLLALKDNHTGLNKILGSLQHNYGSILARVESLEALLLVLKGGSLNIIEKYHSLSRTVTSERQASFELKTRLENVNQESSRAYKTIELELNLFKNALRKKEEDNEALRQLLRRSEELMKITKRQLESLENTSKTDASQSVVAQDLLKQLAEKDMQLEASKNIGIATMKELNSAKAKIQQLKARQLEFLSGVDDNMEHLRETLGQRKILEPPKK